MAYKIISADLAIEVEDDNVGFLRLEVRNNHAGHSVRHRLRVHTVVRGICVLHIYSSSQKSYC